MSYGIATGENLQNEHNDTSELFLKNTNVHDGRCETYDTITKKSSRIVQKSNLKIMPQIIEIEESINTSKRYAFREYLRIALDDVKKMEEAANEDDNMDLAIAGISLKNNLQNLWKLRELRKIEWQTILNFLQSALTQEDFENFTIKQCSAIKNIIENHLSVGELSEYDVARTKEILRKNNFDPWLGISTGPSQE